MISARRQSGSVEDARGVFIRRLCHNAPGFPQFLTIRGLRMKARRAMRILTAFGLLLAAVALPLSGHAAQSDQAEVQAKMQEAVARLKLTPEQEAQLKPVMAERAKQFKAIREKHAGDTSKNAKRAMMKEMRPVQKDYEKKVRAILTDEQEKEWDKMRNEARQRMKEKYGSAGVAD
jgi:hypothetical protein